MALTAASPSYHPSFPAPVAPSISARPWRGRSLLRRRAASSGRHAPASVNNRRYAALQGRPSAVGRRRCDCFDLHRQLVPFLESQAWQESVVARRKGLAGRGEDHSDTLIALQHPPVFTLGSGTTDECLHFDEEDPPFGFEAHRVERAGKATYHGPGELVIYPILNLRHHGKHLDLYLRSLEEVIIRALQSAFSIRASRVDGLTGVWVGDQKVASIGIHVVFPRYITFQGVALNVTTDLSPFEMIVPCGIKGCRMGSIKGILQKDSDGRGIDETSLMDRAYNSVIKEFAEVFKLSLEHSPNWSLQQSSDFN
ncbi:unnamed protein product [Urochloa decumbens]|uniref:lipoyl(octanoyl) transferase n=1 Tax=Urochloa decumbens TaxID=240449 RepID=A0ABC8WCP3_9POAL